MIAAGAIPLFYLPVFFFASDSNFAVDTWRVWIVHLPVEGFWGAFRHHHGDRAFLSSRRGSPQDRNPGRLSRRDSLQVGFLIFDGRWLVEFRRGQHLRISH
jgi:hypothetical protein